MGDLHVAALQRPRQLHVVVAGQADRVARRRHRHHQLQHRRRVRARGRSSRRRRSRGARRGGVALRPSSRDLVAELGRAARPARRGSRGRRRSRRTGRARRAGRSTAASGAARPPPPPRPSSSTQTRWKPSRRSFFAAPFSLRALLADDVRAEVAVGPRAVALLADRLGQVEDDRDREEVVLAGQLAAAACAPSAARWSRRPRSAAAAPAACAAMKLRTAKASRGRRLVVFVVGDEAAAEVRGDHLGRREVAGGEGALAASPRRRPAPPGSGSGRSILIGPPRLIG